MKDERVIINYKKERQKSSLGLFKVKLFGRILLRITLALSVIGAILFVVDGLYNNVIADFLSSFNRPFYLFLRSNKWPILVTVLALILIFTIYFTLVKTTGYIDLIIHNINKVFSQDEGLIQLPADFKEVENQLNAIKFQALRNEQLSREAEQRKNDLVVYLAHDLKTPLTSVIGYLSLLNDEEELPPELRQKYEAIALKKAKRLEALINEFFEITRFSLQDIALEKKEVNLTRLLLQLTDESSPMLLKKGLTCQVSLPPKLTLYCDADKMARVFDNILRNAINYSTPGTQIHIAGEVEGKLVRLTFENTGDTIPPYKLERIFEKFYRLDEARSTDTGGAGLGLAISKEIVERHDGTIAVASEAGKTCFTLTLPQS